MEAALAQRPSGMMAYSLQNPQSSVSLLFSCAVCVAPASSPVLTVPQPPGAYSYYPNPAPSSSSYYPPSYPAFPAANPSLQSLSFAHGSSSGLPGNGPPVATSGHGSFPGYNHHYQHPFKADGVPRGTDHHYHSSNPSIDSTTYAHLAPYPPAHSNAHQYYPLQMPTTYPIHVQGARYGNNQSDGFSYGNSMLSPGYEGFMSINTRINGGARPLGPGVLWRGGIYCNRCQIFDHWTFECTGRPVCFKCHRTGHTEVVCPARVIQSYCRGCLHRDVYHMLEHCLGQEKEDHYIMLRVQLETERLQVSRTSPSNAPYQLPTNVSPSFASGSASAGRPDLPPLPPRLPGHYFDVSTINLSTASLDFDEYLRRRKRGLPGYSHVKVSHPLGRQGRGGESFSAPRLQEPQQFSRVTVSAVPEAQNDAELMPAVMPMAMLLPFNLPVASLDPLDTALGGNEYSTAPEAVDHATKETLPTIEEEPNPEPEKPLEEPTDRNPSDAPSPTTPKQSLSSMQRKQKICPRLKKRKVTLDMDEIGLVFLPGYVPTSEPKDDLYQEYLSEEQIVRLRRDRARTGKGSPFSDLKFRKCTISDCGCPPPPELDQLLPPHHCDNCGPCGHTISQCHGRVTCWKCNRPGHKSFKCPAEAIHYENGCPGCFEKTVYHTRDDCPGIKKQNRFTRMVAKQEKADCEAVSAD